MVEEEWSWLGLDPRQWAHGKWWSIPVEGEDPQLLVPQPAPPLADPVDWADMMAGRFEY